MNGKQLFYENEWAKGYFHILMEEVYHAYT